MARLTAALLLAFGLASAAEWPRFRGPNGSGVLETTDLPTELGPNKNLLWKVKVPSGNSSPILSNGRIFLTAQEGDERVVLALDAGTGRLLWRRSAVKARAEAANPKNGHASATPVADGANVYAFFPDLGLVSYDAEGAERWRAPLGPFHSVQGLAASPILVDDTVVLLIDQTEESYIAAFDRENGRRKWKTSRPSGFLGGYSTPALYEPASGPRQIVAVGSLQFAGYRTDTGETLWSITGVTKGPATLPVFGPGTVFVCEPPGETPPFKGMLGADKNKDGKLSPDEIRDPGMARLFAAIDRDYGNKDGDTEASEWDRAFAAFQGKGGLMAVRLDGRGELTDAHIRWNYAKSLPYISSPLLYRDVLYVVRDGGIVSSFNPETGELLKQARVPDAPGEYYASPVAGDGKIFLVSEAGKVSVLKAGAQWELHRRSRRVEPRHPRHRRRASLHPDQGIALLLPPRSYFLILAS